MSNAIYTLFNRSIKWNAFEGIVYQSVLTTHQVILFYFVGCSLYGLVGVLFSILYLFILFLNFGFDKSLATFYTEFIKSRNDFKKIFISQFLIQILLLTLIFLLIIVFNKQVASFFALKYKCLTLPLSIWIILGLLLITESTKKSLRYICELSFLNKYVSITEVLLIIFYVSSFWGTYFCGYTIDLFLVFLPHLAQSIIGIIILSWLTKNKIYKTLSNTKSSCISINNIIFSRVSNYINQLSHLLFSGNFLIPVLSSIYGLEQISILKLINVIAIYFTVILERTFGLTSSAFLSHLKNLPNKIKENALNIATNRLFIVFSAILIFISINFKPIFYNYSKLGNLNWLAIYFFLLVSIFENFFITLEQYFIVENKVYYFFGVNLISAFLFYLIASIFELPLIILLFLLLVLRILSFIISKIILHKILKINLHPRINYIYILLFISFSLIFLIFLKFIMVNL